MLKGEVAVKLGPGEEEEEPKALRPLVWVVHAEEGLRGRWVVVLQEDLQAWPDHLEDLRALPEDHALRGCVLEVLSPWEDLLADHPWEEAPRDVPHLLA